MTYISITRFKGLESIDEKECVEGYYDGFKNEPEPKGNRSHSYWHGWRSGMVDGGHAILDDAQRELASDYVLNRMNKLGEVKQ